MLTTDCGRRPISQYAIDPAVLSALKIGRHCGPGRVPTPQMILELPLLQGLFIVPFERSVWSASLCREIFSRTVLPPRRELLPRRREMQQQSR